MKREIRGFWGNLANQKQFMLDFATKFNINKFERLHKNNCGKWNEIALKYDIKKPQDWKKISSEQIIVEGGATLLHKYRNSLLETLKNVYEGTFPILLDS